MKKNYEMTEADLEQLFEMTKPVPMIMLQCGQPTSPQEMANSFWKGLGKRMGFDFMTVRPTGQGDRFFSATETPQKETDDETCNVSVR